MHVIFATPYGVFMIFSTTITPEDPNVLDSLDANHNNKKRGEKIDHWTLPSDIGPLNKK